MRTTVLFTVILSATIVSHYTWSQEARDSLQPSPSAQAAASEKKPPESVSPVRPLRIVRRIEIPSEPGGIFGPALKCDANGNLFITVGSEPLTPIHKFDASGRRLASFEAAETIDLKPAGAGYFSVSSDGELYQFVFPNKGAARYIFQYSADGKLKTRVKTDPGFAWIPAQLAPLPKGAILIAGQKILRDPKEPMPPFTGILSADGALLKEVQFSDDDDLTKKVAEGDPSVSSPMSPAINRAIALGAMEVGADGNVYVMRRTAPAATFYVVNAGGSVVRRFKVHPGDSEFAPSTVHVTKSRIAVLFRRPGKPGSLLKITDLEGNEVAAYSDLASDVRERVGSAFVCYSEDPEQFTFLMTTKDGKLGLMIAEGR